MSNEAQAGFPASGSRLGVLLPRRRALPRWGVLVAASALFAGIFLLRLRFGDPGEASVFYVVPIALVALEFGIWAGLGGAALGLGLVGLGTQINDVDLGLIGYLSRGSAFVALGALLGYLSRQIGATGADRGQETGAAWNLEEQLEHLADHDSLTGLLNRRRFEIELAHRVAEADGDSTGAVLVLDLDNFRYVNDTDGHRAGDVLIRSLARLIGDCVPDADVLARLSGDEFAILLTPADADRARAVAETLVNAVRQHSAPVGKNGARITATVGVTLFAGQDEISAEELLVEADLAMYEAKEAGRDRFAVYSASRNSQGRMLARLGWRERIREALENDGFVLYCQPILDLHSGEISQYELLLRMVDEDGKVILPAEFLSSAERFGLIMAIDRCVVRKAIHLIADHARAGHNLRVEVNLSGKSVGDPELPELIERELAATGINPANLILEVTETAAIANMDDARAFAARLADLGCRFALDDFGTGFGSFYYLKHLPLDYLKIDGEFIRSLPHNLTDQLVVKAMVQVAEGLSDKTIAEFVGDHETVELLEQYGVDYAQGYHIGRPRPVSEIWGDLAEAAA